MTTTPTIGRCRDCKHWLFTRREMLAELPRDRSVADGYIDGICPKLRKTLSFDISFGWDGGTLDSVATDANFGCVLFEEANTQTP